MSAVLPEVGPRPTQLEPSTGVFGLGTVALLAGVVAGLALGPVSVGPLEVLRILGLGLVPGGAEAVGVAPPEAVAEAVVWGLRVPRVVLGVAVGASLGLAGALVQGWFRNALAEPGVIGVTTGAALAACAVIVGGSLLGVASAPWMVSGAAFLGALGSVAVVHRVGTVDGRAHVPTLLLGGIALNALFAAGTGLLLTVADDRALRDFTFWTFGSVGSATPDQLMWVLPGLLLGAVPALRFRASLDALLLGAATARHLGHDPARVQGRLMLVVAWLVGVSVSATGAIGFVGMVAPHLVRLVAGPRHAVVLPGSALLGAALVVWADVVARTLVSPVELPIGVLTTLLGGPLFLSLLVSLRRSLR